MTPIGGERERGGGGRVTRKVEKGKRKKRTLTKEGKQDTAELS